MEFLNYNPRVDNWCFNSGNYPVPIRVGNYKLQFFLCFRWSSLASLLRNPRRPGYVTQNVTLAWTVVTRVIESKYWLSSDQTKITIDVRVAQGLNLNRWFFLKRNYWLKPLTGFSSKLKPKKVKKNSKLMQPFFQLGYFCFRLLLQCLISVSLSSYA
jgi:hypothetical protein